MTINADSIEEDSWRRFPNEVSFWWNFFFRDLTQFYSEISWGWCATNVKIVKLTEQNIRNMRMWRNQVCFRFLCRGLEKYGVKESENHNKKKWKEMKSEDSFWVTVVIELSFNHIILHICIYVKVMEYDDISVELNRRYNLSLIHECIFQNNLSNINRKI